MGNRLKRKAAFFLAVAFSLMLISCSGVTPQAGKSSVDPEVIDKISITFMSYWGGSSSYRDLVEKTIADFMEKNPDISVTNDSLSNEDYLAKLKTNFVSGYIPDVFYLWPGYDLVSLIAAGQIANLKETMLYDPDWETSFSSYALEHNRYNMGLYGVPFETCFTGLYINKRILSENNILVPRTYDELRKAIINLYKNDIIPIAYSSRMDGSLLYQTIVASLSNRVTSLQYPINGSSDPSYVEAMKIMKDLYKMNAFPKNSFILSGYDQNKLFLSGEAAMVLEGSWYSGYMDQMKDPVELVPFPAINPVENQGYNLICVNGFGSFHVSSKAFEDPKIKDACIRFLKYFTSSEVACNFIAEKGMISALNLDDSVYQSNYYAKQGLDIIRKSNDIYKFPYEIFGENIWEDVFINQFPYMLEDRITPEELYNQAIKRLPER